MGPLGSLAWHECVMSGNGRWSLGAECSVLHPQELNSSKDSELERGS